MVKILDAFSLKLGIRQGFPLIICKLYLNNLEFKTLCWCSEASTNTCLRPFLILGKTLRWPVNRDLHRQAPKSEVPVSESLLLPPSTPAVLSVVPN